MTPTPKRSHGQTVGTDSSSAATIFVVTTVETATTQMASCWFKRVKDWKLVSS